MKNSPLLALPLSMETQNLICEPINVHVTRRNESSYDEIRVGEGCFGDDAKVAFQALSVWLEKASREEPGLFVTVDGRANGKMPIADACRFFERQAAYVDVPIGYQDRSFNVSAKSLALTGGVALLSSSIASHIEAIKKGIQSFSTSISQAMGSDTASNIISSVTSDQNYIVFPLMAVVASGLAAASSLRNDMKANVSSNGFNACGSTVSMFLRENEYNGRSPNIPPPLNLGSTIQSGERCEIGPDDTGELNIFSPR